MRLPLLLALALALALAACATNDPPLPSPDGGDAGAADVGVDAGAVDVGEDRPAPIDTVAADAGSDAGFHGDPIPLADLGGEAGAGDAGGDAADVGTDSPADDDAGACGRCVGAHVVRAGCLASDARPPRCLTQECDRFFADCNGDIADGCEVDARNDRANCGGCAAACRSGEVCMLGTCTAPDASVGDRMNCQVFGPVACTTSAQCQAVCLPGTSTNFARWCCTGAGSTMECSPTSNTFCARP